MKKKFYILLIGFVTCSGFSQSNTAVASFLVLDQKLEQFSIYIQLNDQENLTQKIDSMYQQLFAFPEQLKKHWLNLKTSDTEKLVAILKIKNIEQQQLALLDWKYNQPNEDLELLLNYYHTIASCADKILFSDAHGNNVFLDQSYESDTAFVAKRDFMAFHELLLKVISEDQTLRKSKTE